MDQYALTPLFHRPDLSGECINLLNQEWPRSYSSREHSQGKSCRLSPPMSFLFIRNDTDKLIGHGRLCPIPNRPNSCWIESVIVVKDCRGVGLGKLLMSSLEEAAKSFGFEEAYLCTRNQVIFYERCGYKKCDPIVHSSTAMSMFPPLLMKQGPKSNDVNLITSATSLKNSAVQEKVPSPERSSPSAIPPPPSSHLVKTPSLSLPTTYRQYMWKKLE